MTTDPQSNVINALLGTQARALLQPIVETSRAVFQAAASSIFLLEPATDSVVFGAVAGEGEQTLVGRRFPADTGIVGWVLGSREAVEFADLANSEVFSREAAQSTGYVPDAIMAAPLLYEDDCVGVLEVLDWTRDTDFGVGRLAVLELIAAQAAAAVRLLTMAAGPGDPFAMPETIGLVQLIGRQLADLSPGERAQRAQLLTSMIGLVAERG